ncbi:MAG: prephenate dehydrogenase/arogenate dehydrogenase family protein [Eggerthellaceae bacterium]|jgi:prephenate dehydrogenase
MNHAINNIAVIGLGVIGASFAAAFSAAHPTARIFGVDTSAETVQTACERGWISAGSGSEDPAFRRFVEEGLLPDETDAVPGVFGTAACDMVLLAIPVDAARDYLEKLEAWGFPNIITDTGSTKTSICAIADEVLSRSERFVPGHPMAGSEKNGIGGADGRLYAGAHWILCPDSRTPEAYYPLMHDMLTSIGARVINMPREEHDRAVAVVSHVPHIVASALVTLAYQHAVDEDDAGIFRLAAGGFKDSTRIAAGSPSLWAGILSDNAEAVLENLSQFQGIVGRFQAAVRTALESHDRTALLELLETSSSVRQTVPNRWLPDTARMYEARINMQNRPGAIAQIVSLASEKGCNIQSISIDHLTASTAVLSLVLTDEGDRDQFKQALDGWGYPAIIEQLGAKEHRHADE